MVGDGVRGYRHEQAGSSAGLTGGFVCMLVNRGLDMMGLVAESKRLFKQTSRSPLVTDISN